MWHSMTTERSPWRGVWLLLATVTATELAMLNVIFWAQAQGTVAGLLLAVVWPWAVAFAIPVIWTNRRRAPRSVAGRLTLEPRLTLGIGLALTATALLGRVIAVA